ncbi:ABC transporter ATP-binding protein [Isoptericola sp. BMS4]|uniref:ABC transporter ATP-binding protein n=1 Tax=Isoptericola sp. BMS4 TaxID=2527875 RepID=UPI00142109D2|nr:ATP-binding cassette domain-containing protein [Isoptericola sp. BMS4]
MTAHGTVGTAEPEEPATAGVDAGHDDAGLDVTGLTVAYPRAARPALDDVSARVPPGEALLVVGLSGSGKSTLLGALAGVLGHTLDAQVHGTALVAGVDVTAGGPLDAARVAALVQQDPIAQTCLDTVRAEVELVLENHAVPAARIPAAAAEALADAHAAGLADRRTAELSGGELQRVALAAALAGRPRVLLADEPTAMLDPRAAREVGALVGHVAAGGTTTVVVEHRLDTLAPLPARTLVLSDGRVLACGPTPDVLAEHGARLAAGGCWVPTRTLLATAGAPGPLGTPATDDWLRDLADRRGTQPETPDPYRPGARRRRPDGGFALHARGLRVRRTRRAGGPWSRARRVDVVHGVDLSLPRGRVLGVVGANGSGKSTLLRGLAGLEPTGGSVRAGRTALAVQHPEQGFLCRTVADELAYGPRRAGLADTDVEAAVAAALRRFGLDGLADRSPYRLSGGQQRRLSLAAAVGGDPDVVLADEPTFGLDRAGTLDTAAILRAEADDGAGVVVVSHDLELLGRVADHVLVLHDGRPLGTGPAEDVLADGELLDAAGLERGPLLERWAGWPRPRPSLRRLLTGLDAAVAAAARSGLPDRTGAPA